MQIFMLKMSLKNSGPGWQLNHFFKLGHRGLKRATLVKSIVTHRNCLQNPSTPLLETYNRQRGRCNEWRFQRRSPPGSCSFRRWMLGRGPVGGTRLRGSEPRSRFPSPERLPWTTEPAAWGCRWLDREASLGCPRLCRCQSECRPESLAVLNDGEKQE